MPHLVRCCWFIFLSLSVLPISQISAQEFAISVKDQHQSALQARNLSKDSLISELLTVHRRKFERDRQNPQAIGIQDADLLPSTWFISPLIDKALMTRIKYDIQKQDSRTIVTAGLSQDGLREVYRSVSSQLQEQAKLNLSTNQRKLFFWSADQLSTMLASLPGNILPEINEMSLFSQELRHIGIQKLTRGTIVFENYESSMTIEIDDQPISQTAVRKLSGEYQFTATQPGYYPLMGKIKLMPNSTQTLNLPMVIKPEVTPRVNLQADIDKELLPYVNRALESYGWLIDPKAKAIFSIVVEEGSVVIDGNDNQQDFSITISYQINSDSFPHDHPNFEKSYFDKQPININDQLALERNRRILVVQSLIQFLSIFEQNDLTLLTEVDE